LEKSPGGLPVAEPTEIARDEEVKEFEESLWNGTREDVFISPKIFRSMIRSGDVKMLHEDFCQDNRDKSSPTLSANKKVTLGQDPGFVSQDEGYKCDSGRICLSVVYYVHRNGFFIACHRLWVRVGANEKVEKGTHDCLGVASRKTKNGKCYSAYLLRLFKILSPITNRDGYHYVNLFDRSVEQHSSVEHVGVIVLATFQENRPYGCVVDHYDGRDNNALYCIKWATYSENNQAHRRSSHEFHTTQYAVMEEDILQDRMVTWYAHPKHRVTLR
jgi:hypothetical protein